MLTAARCKPFCAQKNVRISLISSNSWPVCWYFDFHMSFFLADGRFSTLAFDWITENVYIGTEDGYVTVCDKNGSPPFTCRPLLTRQKELNGIALDPIQGYARVFQSLAATVNQQFPDSFRTMYWTIFATRNGSIRRASMDSTGPSIIVTGLDAPHGTAIDFKMSRTYWADDNTDKIQSSYFDGSDLQTTFEYNARPGRKPNPRGIAVLGDELFWTNWWHITLVSRTRNSSTNHVRYSGYDRIRELAAVPKLGLPRNRINHCKRQQCSGVCVLAATSYRCLT